MANTFCSLHIHVIFSTKRRERFITPEIEARLWPYLGGIARESRVKPLCIGGVDDHIHLLLGLTTTHTISKVVQSLKGGSSKWVHENYPELRAFGWQDGYGAFSIGSSQITRTMAYIQNQKEHHRTRTFKEEYIEFLQKHGIEYDERYVFD